MYKRIRDLRERLHLSQEYVARYLGEDISVYRQIESGERRVSAGEIDRLGTLFGVSIDRLKDAERHCFDAESELITDHDKDVITKLIELQKKAKG